MKRKGYSLVALLALLSACSGVNFGDGGSTTSDHTNSSPIVNDSSIPEMPSFPDDSVSVNTGTYTPVEGDVTITLSDHNSQVSPATDGVSVVDNQITILQAGNYILSGHLTDGQVVVNVSKEDKVYLVFNGVEIHCTSSAPLYSSSSDRTFITLAEDSVNRLTDAGSYTFAPGSDEPNACLFSKDDLTIDGTGTLFVTSLYNNGIGSKNDLKIKSGTIVVDAINHGIRGNDSVTIQDGQIQVTCQGDGIKSSTTDTEGKGYIEINGGSISLTAGCDGFDTATDLSINGGNIEIMTGEGSAVGMSHSSNWGSSTTTGSYKALKSASSLSISNGKITIDSQDDAIHCDGSITISGGEINISSGDDGIHADETLTISGGQIRITKSYEGLEGLSVLIQGGDIEVTASDDGVNAAGGDGSGGSRPGMSTCSTCSVTIDDGYLFVNASGDGLDSNGNLNINGGTIIVQGPTDSGNGALDCDGNIVVKGGTLIASGSSGMAEQPGNSSTQYSVHVKFSSTQRAGQIVHLVDSSGKVIATMSSSKSFASVVISSSDLQRGSTYSVYYGGSYQGGSERNGFYTGGTYTSGTLYQTFTISSITTSVGSSGGGGGRP